MMGDTESYASNMSGGHHQCPFQGNEKFESSQRGTVGILEATRSHISSPKIFKCSTESLDEEVCCARTMS